MTDRGGRSRISAVVPFFSQTGAPLVLLLQEKYRLAGFAGGSVREEPARVARARQNRIRIKSLRYRGSRRRKQAIQECEGGSATISGNSGAYGANQPRIWVHETF